MTVAAYDLNPAAVARLIKLGVDVGQVAGFGGGTSPVLAALLGLADAHDVGEASSAKVEACVEVLAHLLTAGADFSIPRTIALDKTLPVLLKVIAGQRRKDVLTVLKLMETICPK